MKLPVPHLDAIYEKRRFNPPHPQLGIDIKFQHQTTLPWQSLRSTSHQGAL